MQNVEKHSKTIRDVDVRKDFLSDLNNLSNARSLVCFGKVKDLFVEKWSKVPEAQHPLENIKKEWFSPRLTRFYRGAAEGYVMNNNGLESTNRVLKDSGTLHQRMPIVEFLPALKRWVTSQSRRRDPENPNYVKIVLDRPDILLRDMTDGYNLMKSKINFIIVQDHYIAVRSGKIGGVDFNYELAKSVYEQYKNDDYESMQQYVAFQSQVHIVGPDRSCNCYTFGRQFKCSHSLCVQILADNLHVEDTAKTILLGGRRQPGRPKKAAGRYIIQDYDLVRANDQLPANNADAYESDNDEYPDERHDDVHKDYYHDYIQEDEPPAKLIRTTSLTSTSPYDESSHMQHNNHSMSATSTSRSSPHDESSDRKSVV